MHTVKKALRRRGSDESLGRRSGHSSLGRRSRRGSSDRNLDYELSGESSEGESDDGYDDDAYEDDNNCNDSDIEKEGGKDLKRHADLSLGRDGDGASKSSKKSKKSGSSKSSKAAKVLEALGKIKKMKPPKIRGRRRSGTDDDRGGGGGGGLGGGSSHHTGGGRSRSGSSDVMYQLEDSSDSLGDMDSDDGYGDDAYREDDDDDSNDGNHFERHSTSSLKSSGGGRSNKRSRGAKKVGKAVKGAGKKVLQTVGKLKKVNPRSAASTLNKIAINPTKNVARKALAKTGRRKSASDLMMSPSAVGGKTVISTFLSPRSKDPRRHQQLENFHSPKSSPSLLSPPSGELLGGEEGQPTPESQRSLQLAPVSGGTSAAEEEETYKANRAANASSKKKGKSGSVYKKGPTKKVKPKRDPSPTANSPSPTYTKKTKTKTNKKGGSKSKLPTIDFSDEEDEEKESDSDSDSDSISDEGSSSDDDGNSDDQDGKKKTSGKGKAKVKKKKGGTATSKRKKTKGKVDDKESKAKKAKTTKTKGKTSIEKKTILEGNWDTDAEDDSKATSQSSEDIYRALSAASSSAPSKKRGSTTSNSKTSSPTKKTKKERVMPYQSPKALKLKRLADMEDQSMGDEESDSDDESIDILPTNKKRDVPPPPPTNDDDDDSSYKSSSDDGDSSSGSSDSDEDTDSEENIEQFFQQGNESGDFAEFTNNVFRSIDDVNLIKQQAKGPVKQKQELKIDNESDEDDSEEEDFEKESDDDDSGSSSGSDDDSNSDSTSGSDEEENDDDDYEVYEEDIVFDHALNPTPAFTSGSESATTSTNSTPSPPLFYESSLNGSKTFMHHSAQTSYSTLIEVASDDDDDHTGGTTEKDAPMLASDVFHPQHLGPVPSPAIPGSPMKSAESSANNSYKSLSNNDSAGTMSPFEVDSESEGTQGRTGRPASRMMKAGTNNPRPPDLGNWSDEGDEDHTPDGSGEKSHSEDSETMSLFSIPEEGNSSQEVENSSGGDTSQSERIVDKTPKVKNYKSKREDPSVYSSDDASPPSPTIPKMDPEGKAKMDDSDSGSGSDDSDESKSSSSSSSGSESEGNSDEDSERGDERGSAKKAQSSERRKATVAPASVTSEDQEDDNLEDSGRPPPHVMEVLHSSYSLREEQRQNHQDSSDEDVLDRHSESMDSELQSYMEEYDDTEGDGTDGSEQADGGGGGGASQLHNFLVKRKSSGELIDDELIEHWDLTAKKEEGKELTKDEKEDLHNSRLFLGIKVDDSDASEKESSQYMPKKKPTPPQGKSQGTAAATYHDLVALKERGEVVDEDLLDYWELAARQEAGTELTESETDDMEGLRQDLGIKIEPKQEATETKMADDMAFKSDSVAGMRIKAEPKQKATEGQMAKKTAPKAQPGAGRSNVEPEGSKERSHRKKPKSMTEASGTATSVFQDLVKRQEKGEHIDDDLMDYWEMASNQEGGMDLTESEFDDMEALRRDLGIKASPAVASKVDRRPAEIDDGENSSSASSTTKEDHSDAMSNDDSIPAIDSHLNPPEGEIDGDEKIQVSNVRSMSSLFEKMSKKSTTSRGKPGPELSSAKGGDEPKKPSVRTVSSIPENKSEKANENSSEGYSGSASSSESSSASSDSQSTSAEGRKVEPTARSTQETPPAPSSPTIDKLVEAKRAATAKLQSGLFELRESSKAELAEAAKIQEGFEEELASSKDKVASQNKELKRLQEKNKELQQLLSEALGKIEQLTNEEMERLTAQNEKRKKQLTEALEKVGQLTNEDMEHIQEANENLQQELFDALEKIEKLRNEDMKEMRDENEGLQQQLAEALQKVEELKSEEMDTRDTQEENAILQRQLSAALQKIDKLTSEEKHTRDTKEENAYMQQRLYAALQEVDQLRNENAELEAQRSKEVPLSQHKGESLDSKVKYEQEAKIISLERVIENHVHERGILEDKLKDANCELDEMGKEMEKLCGEIDDLKETCDEYRTLNDELEETMKESETSAHNIDEMTVLLDEKDARIKELEETRDADSAEPRFMSSLEFPDEEKAVLQEKLNIAKQKVDEMENELAESMQGIKSLKNRATESEKQLESVNEALTDKENTIKDLEQSLSEKVSRIKELESNASAGPTNQIEGLKCENQELKDKLALESKRASSLADELEDRDFELGVLNQKVHLADSDVVELKNRISDLEDENEGLKKGGASISQQPKTVDSGTASVSSKMSIKDRIKAFESDSKSKKNIESLEDVNSNLRWKMKKLQSSISDMNEKLQEKDETIDYLHKQLFDGGGDGNATYAEFEALRKQVSQKDAEIADVKRALSDANTKVDSVRVLEEENAELRRTIDNFKLEATTRSFDKVEKRQDSASADSLRAVQQENAQLRINIERLKLVAASSNTPKSEDENDDPLQEIHAMTKQPKAKEVAGLRAALRDAMKKISAFKSVNDENKILRTKMSEYATKTAENIAAKDKAVAHTIGALQKKVIDVNKKSAGKLQGLSRHIKQRDFELDETRKNLEKANKEIARLNGIERDNSNLQNNLEEVRNMGQSLLSEKDTAINSLNEEIKVRETEVAETKLMLKELQQKVDSQIQNQNHLEETNQTLQKEIDKFTDVRDALKDATKKLALYHQLEEENVSLRMKFQQYQNETSLLQKKRDETIMKTISNLQKSKTAIEIQTQNEKEFLAKELQKREIELSEVNDSLKEASQNILKLWEENSRLQVH